MYIYLHVLLMIRGNYAFTPGIVSFVSRTHQKPLHTYMNYTLYGPSIIPVHTIVLPTPDLSKIHVTNLVHNV